MVGFLSRSMNAIGVWFADDDGNALGTASNPLVTTAAGGANSSQVQGNVASGTTDSGNPVKVGGRTPAAVGAITPLATNGDRMDFLADRYGNQRTLFATVNLDPNTGTPSAAGYSINAQRGADTPPNAVPLAVLDGWWDGTRVRVAMGDANGGFMATVPTGTAAVGLNGQQTTAAAASIVLKASAGNLYGFEVCAGASAGYLMVFDSATVPADGTVTPKRVYAIAANASLSRQLSVPLRMASGIVLVFSTTGPFSKTASATAFLAGDYV